MSKHRKRENVWEIEIVEEKRTYKEERRQKRKRCKNNSSKRKMLSGEMFVR